MNSTAAVVDVTLQNFESEVVLRSRTTPVLVDFWATWCGPCKTLGPILEKLAGEAQGRFVLAKIDIDRTPELAEAFGIQSVPTVMLMKAERPVDGFLGAQPESAVKKFLEKNLGVVAPDVVAEAKQLEQAGQRAQAIELLRTHAKEHHDDVKARLALARLLVADGQVEDAKLLLAKLPEAERNGEEGLSLAKQVEFLGRKAGLETLAERALAAPDDLALQLEHGQALVASGEHERGLEQLWSIAQRDVAFDGGAPRKALLAAFEVLGWEHPLSLEYQRRLSVLLCG